MVNGDDVLVLLRLAAHPGPWTFRGLGGELGIDPAALHRSAGRLRGARLIDDSRQVNKGNVEEFLIHAVQYVLPGELGASGRGVPTAWGAEPLLSLVSSSEDAPVWPDARGAMRGPTLRPIARAAPRLSVSDPELGEWLALVDAVRVGAARERKLAWSEIERRLWGPGA